MSTSKTMSNEYIVRHGSCLTLVCLVFFWGGGLELVGLFVLYH